MLSTKNILACLGKTGPASVLPDIFGFNWAPSRLSLKRQLQLMKGTHLHMNFITVGDFAPADWNVTYQAVQIARDIYAQVDLGIGRIQWYSINGSGVLDKDDAEDLTSDWTVPNDGHDVFVVRQMTGGADGRSAVDGGCDKNGKGWSGSVVSLNSGANNAGNTFAHEIGHYLGLDHVPDSGNFIGGNGGSNSWTGIFSWQGDEMKQHCWMRAGCPD